MKSAIPIILALCLSGCALKDANLSVPGLGVLGGSSYERTRVTVDVPKGETVVVRVGTIQPEPDVLPATITIDAIGVAVE